jgi:putative membrane protein
MRLLISLSINTLAILTGAYVLRGIHVESVLTALVVAIVMGILNVFLKPLLILLTLPLTVLTLGLFLFVLNALMVMLAGQLVKGFQVDNFWWALLYSLIVSFVSSFLNTIV